jgi:dehydrogenase/reductase SDR family member 12
MTRLIETATTSLDQAAAFANVAEFANIDNWDPGVALSVKQTPGPTGVGTVYALTLNYNGRAMNMTYTVTEYDPNSRIVLEGKGNLIAAVDTITFEPNGSGTVVTYQADLRLTGIARLMQPLMKSRFESIGTAAGNGLRKWLTELEG